MKNQYKKDIEEEYFPYRNVTSAIERIRIIYKTARVGNVSHENACELWRIFFSKIYQERKSIPAKTFDGWQKNKVKRLSLLLLGLLPKRNGAVLGIAQKMLNLFLKDLWAWGKLPRKIDSQLHMPLDRLILHRLFKMIPEKWTAWTHVIFNEKTFEKRYREYAKLQNDARDYHKDPAQYKDVVKKRANDILDRGSFDSLIEMEQFLWHELAR